MPAFVLIQYKHRGNSPGRARLPQCVLLRDNPFPFGPKDAGGPGDATPPRGLSPFGFARVGNLEPTELAARRNFGRSPFWEGPSHALPDPGKTPASNASRPPLASAVNDGPATSMSRLAGHLVLADAEVAIPRR